ncbi:MAG TPA: hypothetical protein VIQ54_29410 [Polyangia bacterium]
MPNAPLSDWERQQVQKYLKEDKYITRARGWIVFLVSAAVCVTSMVLTQPWPKRGAGGGYVENGFLGPYITTVVTLATLLILSRLLARKEKQHAPRLTGDPQQQPPPEKKP